MTGAWLRENIRPRIRVVCDNDYCGDPDGVVQIAHHLLCDSVETPFVISSAVGRHHFEWTADCPTRGVGVVRRVAELVGRADLRVVEGSALPMPSTVEPAASEAVDALIAEAMRDDTDLPLFVAVGGGLTAVASAYLREPRIAERITVVWLGGERLDRTEVAGDVRFRETNLNTDLAAARVVFDSPIPLWHMPQGTFDQTIISRAEYAVRVRPQGPLGAHVFDAIGRRVDMMSQGITMGETYTMGDQALVLLTALWGSYVPEPSTSTSTERPRPRIDERGLYADTPDGAPVRLFTRLDVRLLMEDFYARLQLHATSMGE